MIPLLKFNTKKVHAFETNLASEYKMIGSGFPDSDCPLMIKKTKIELKKARQIMQTEQSTKRPIEKKTKKL